MTGMAGHRAMWAGRARVLTICYLAVLVAVSIGVLLVARPAHAATFTVNSAADPGTDGCDATECTLREAITAANANDNEPTVDLINFAIPGAGPHTISPASALPLITNPVIIDGYSQPGASANTLAVGNDAVLKIELSGPDALNGLKIEADNSTVKGLIISNWENGVFLDTDATGNTVRGSFIGTDASGAGLGNNIGVVALGDDNTIGGTTAGARNIISDNGSGVQIGSANGGNKVQGNFIGTKANGTEPLANNNGVVIDGSPNNTIGGTTATARNIISGNSVFGIRIAFPGAAGNKVQGNFIGTNARGTQALGNGDDGVRVQEDADNNTIGGTTATARNIISGNGSDGVEVFYFLPPPPNPPPDPPTGNRILSNSIYDNDALGIDLFHSNDPPGPTPNDTLPPPDSDVGPNNLQNYPDLDLARTRRGATTIKGTLTSTPDGTFVIQFFSSLAADPSGFGEGQKFKGQKSVTDTNGDGIITFTFKPKKKVPNGQVVTATATNQSTGDTSEFSKACTVPGVPCP